MAQARLKEKKAQSFSVEEYLELDRASDERYEFFDGQVYLMAGESGNHGDISTNITAELREQLKGKDCRVRAKDTKIKSGSFAAQKDARKTKGMFSYPDILVICGEPQYHDKRTDIVLNPSVVVEVLSDSTAEFDRTNKFTRYRMFNATLSDYVLVSQDKPLVEHYIRQADDGWKVFIYYGLKEVVNIESIECRLKLVEIYDRIEFSKEALADLAEIIDNKV